MSYNFPLLGAGRPGDPAGPVVPHMRLADHLLLLRFLHRGADQLHGQQAASSKVEKQYFASFDLLTSRLGARAYYSLASILRETDGSQQLVKLPQVGRIWTKTWELKNLNLNPQGLKWQKARRLLLRLDKREMAERKRFPRKDSEGKKRAMMEEELERITHSSTSQVNKSERW